MLEMNKLTAYELLKQQRLEALNSDGYVLRHKKTGARVCLIANDDENKVFEIGFRTPQSDDTGVPHIIEHTVLCGSDKFPLKDPFVELIKGSMNTFINAMTFPDKTIYPVASCNDKDFHNLMDVYLDAVFHPNIYKYEEIFKQEGWHYEMENEDAPLTINGVVYNEMKGAYSSPDELMMIQMYKALFPDTCYSKDSGGTPSVIPSLTREAYLDFHRAYYHPCNSFIYLYGDMNMEEKLCYIDEEYLSKFDEKVVQSEIKLQKPFDKPVEVEEHYSISTEESEENKTIFGYSVVAGDALDKETYLAMDVLCYALLQSPGAPLKKALLDAGIGNDVYGAYETAQRQHCFVIETKNANAKDYDRFKSTIETVLKDIVKKGLDKKTLEAGINSMEFKYREADFGSFPKGLLYVLQSLESWLYDESDPFMHIDALDTFKFLRDKLNTSYYEELIQERILNNNHCVYVTLTPEKGLAIKQEEELAKDLAEKKAAMSKEEIAKIVEGTKRLIAYQEEPTSEEALQTIPMLGRKDIKQEPLEINNKEYRIEQIPVLHHDLFTNQIHYVHYLFNVKKLSNELLPYLGILKNVWGLLDTEAYSYAELSSEIDRTTGGIGTSFGCYEKINSTNQFDLKVVINAKTFYGQLDKATKLIAEIIMNSKYDDSKRLKELISEIRSRMLDDIIASGNKYGALRAESYHSRISSVMESIQGIAFYQFLANIDDHFEDEKDRLITNLKKLNTMIFRKENLLVSSTCEKEEFECLEAELKYLCKYLSSDDFEDSPKEPIVEKKNEAFMTSSQVQYVCQTGNFRDEGYSYTGAMHLLRNVLSYEYLWQNIRVKGGAYGCSGSMEKTGMVKLTTYRDPNLKNSYEVFAGIPDYLEKFDVDEREMTKYVIGTIGAMDMPLNPCAKGLRSTGMYLRGITIDDLRRERLQVINATVEDIRALAEPMRAALQQNNICVVGSEDKIKEDKELFSTVCNL